MSFRWLKRMADWLDNRFPAKVHVTDEAFQALLRHESERQMRANTQEAELAVMTQKLKNLGIVLENLVPLLDRVDSLEGTLGQIKEVVTKAAAPEAQASARRAAFVASGRMPE